MIKSMTGFGRYEYADEKCKITIEIKSVNHRYLETSIRMPKQLNFFEVGIRNELKNYVQRGKVDIFVSYEDLQTEQVYLKYNEDLASEYMNIFEEMADRFGIDNDIRVSTLSRFPEVISMESETPDEEELWAVLKECFNKACENFVKTRVLEGEKLLNNLVEKLDNMITMVKFIEEKSPELVDEYRKKLEEKLAEILSDKEVDDNKIATEVVLYADKICVDEETVRLLSHIEATKATLLEGGGVGRKLDFIAQEMNREANTILSKANSLEITNVAIDLKTEIEKVREQIQNIE